MNKTDSIPFPHRAYILGEGNKLMEKKKKKVKYEKKNKKMQILAFSKVTSTQAPSGPGPLCRDLLPLA